MTITRLHADHFARPTSAAKKINGSKGINRNSVCEVESLLESPMSNQE